VFAKQIGQIDLLLIGDGSWLINRWPLGSDYRRRSEPSKRRFEVFVPGIGIRAVGDEQLDDILILTISCPVQGSCSDIVGHVHIRTVLQEQFNQFLIPILSGAGEQRPAGFIRGVDIEFVCQEC